MGSSFNNPPMLNNAVFTIIIRHLERESQETVGQPHLIVGEHGSGKTTLLRRLFDEVSSQHTNFSAVWLDGRKLFTSNDIIESIGSGRVILFIDDFHYYLQRTPAEQHYLLRGALSAKGGPILIASVPTVPSQLTNYGAAFYDAFRIHYLKPLSADELERLVGTTGMRIERCHQLMEYLPKTVRSAVIVSDIVKRSHSSTEDIRLLKDHFSPLYQTRFDALPPQQQRILLALAGENEGLRLSGIRTKTGQEASAISPYLTLMMESGLLTRDSATLRGGLYKISDPLFNLWLQ